MGIISVDDYENLVNRILSGNYSTEDLTKFALSTPILPILAKMQVLKNKAIIDVIVTDENGNPVQAEVLLAGETKPTNAEGKSEFIFNTDVPPGYIIIKKDNVINKIPFGGAKLGDKITIATIFSKQAESPVAFGQSLKDIINTYYQWKLINDIEKGVFQPNIANMPQVGVLKKLSDYQYQVYIPVPVNIIVPKINFQPVVGVPGQTPVSLPVEQPQPTKKYEIKLHILPGENANQHEMFNITIFKLPEMTPIKNMIGGYGTYTFSNIDSGKYRITIVWSRGEVKKDVDVEHENVDITVYIRGAIPTPTPTPTPTPVPSPQPPAAKGAIKLIITNPTNIPVNVLIDKGKTVHKTVWRGQFLFDKIPAGRHTLELIYNDKRVLYKEITVLPNTVVVVRYTVPSTAPVPIPTPHPPMPAPTPTPGMGSLKLVIEKGVNAPSVPKILVEIGNRKLNVTRYGAYTYHSVPPGEYNVKIIDCSTGTCHTVLKKISVAPNRTVTITYVVVGNTSPSPIHPGPTPTKPITLL